MTEALVHESRIAVPYAWSAGATGTRFLKTLAAEKRFLATRCAACAQTYVPPLKACSRCLKDCGEWVEVGPRGKLISFTQALYESPVLPCKRPVYGLIRLDGADTALLIMIGEATLEELQADMPMEPVFSEPGGPGLHQLVYFRPARKRI